MSARHRSETPRVQDVREELKQMVTPAYVLEHFNQLVVKTLGIFSTRPEYRAFFSQYQTPSPFHDFEVLRNPGTHGCEFDMVAPGVPWPIYYVTEREEPGTPVVPLHAYARTDNSNEASWKRVADRRTRNHQASTMFPACIAMPRILSTHLDPDPSLLRTRPVLANLLMSDWNARTETSVGNQVCRWTQVPTRPLNALFENDAEGAMVRVRDGMPYLPRVTPLRADFVRDGQVVSVNVVAVIVNHHPPTGTHVPTLERLLYNVADLWRPFASGVVPPGDHTAQHVLHGPARPAFFEPPASQHPVFDHRSSGTVAQHDSGGMPAYPLRSRNHGFFLPPPHPQYPPSSQYPPNDHVQRSLGHRQRRLYFPSP
ncbi:hypothetical protein JCM10212_003333 [Sporobolomyces blumeae]